MKLQTLSLLILSQCIHAMEPSERIAVTPAPETAASAATSTAPISPASSSITGAIPTTPAASPAAPVATMSPYSTPGLEQRYRKDIASVKEVMTSASPLAALLPADLGQLIGEFANPMRPISIEQINRYEGALAEMERQFSDPASQLGKLPRDIQKKVKEYVTLLPQENVVYEISCNGAPCMIQRTIGGYFDLDDENIRNEGITYAKTEKSYFELQQDRRGYPAYRRSVFVKCSYEPDIPTGTAKYECRGELEGRVEPGKQKEMFEKLEKEFNEVHAAASLAMRS